MPTTRPTSRLAVVVTTAAALAAVAAAPAQAARSAQADPAPSALRSTQVGLNPYEVVTLPRTGTVYTANPGDGTVTVLNGRTGAVKKTLVLDSTPTGTPGSAPADNPDTGAYGLAANPLTDRVYTTNTLSSSVTVIDGRSHKVLSTFPVSGRPHGIAVNPRTNKVYVALPRSADSPEFRVDVYDGRTNAFVRSVSAGRAPVKFAVDVVTNTVYVADSVPRGGTGDGAVFALDGATDAVKHALPLPVGTNPRGLAVDDVTGRLYVTSFSASKLLVLDGLRKGRAITTTEVPVAASPLNVAVNPITWTVFVTSFSAAGQVTAIDGRTDAVLSTIQVGARPLGVAVLPTLGTAYVTNRDTSLLFTLKDRKAIRGYTR